MADSDSTVLKESITPTGGSQDPLDLISKANEAAANLDKSNKEFARLLSIQQQMMIEKTLSGTTNAGKASLTDDEKDLQEAKKLLAGTGLEEMAFPIEK